MTISFQRSTPSQPDIDPFLVITSIDLGAENFWNITTGDTRPLQKPGIVPTAQ